MKPGYLLFFLLLSVSVTAQKKGQDLVDSILGILPGMPEDTNKLKALNKIGETYMMIDPAKGIGYAQQGLAMAGQLKYKRGISRFNNLIGLLVGDTGNNTQARVYFERSLVTNQEIDNSFGMISNLNNIGRTYQRESNYTKALDNYLKALAIAERIRNNEQIALVGTNLTSSYYAQKNYSKALESAFMTLKYARLANSANNMAKTLLHIGTIKQDLMDTVAARKYLDSAESMYEEMGNRMVMAQIISQKATLEFPDYEKGIAALLKAQQIFDEIAPSSLFSIDNLANLGEGYYQLALLSKPDKKKEHLAQAAQYLTRAITYCKEANNIEYQANMYNALSRVQEASSQYQPALESFRRFYSINDSLFSQEKKNQLASLESQHKMELKDNEIAINKLQLANQRRTLLFLVIGLGLLGVIGALLLWQNRMRKKSNTTLMVMNNQLDEANKIKLKFFGILSHDLRSPISSLANYLHLLKNAPDLLSPEEAGLGQQQIGQSTQELLQTLETMLLWSKEQMEHFKPDIKLVSVSNLFDYLQKFFVPSGPVKLTFEDPDGLAVLADENYLQVIMQNLTANAIKTLGQSATGEVVWSARKSGSQTMLSIRDNGPGIREEQAKSLFDETYTVNARSGFGFHLIRDLAKAIRFRITFESSPGTGTTFILSAI